MILLIDNYDSFVHNLARYVRQLGAEVVVKRNDEISIAEIAALKPSRIIISPGPKTPNDAGICLELVKHFATTIPILGICLGHQVIAAAFGAEVVRSEYPMHGKASKVSCGGNYIFHALPGEFTVGRYHSLIVANDSLPDCLQVIATTDKQEIMALCHKDLPVIGLQFHPESVLTDYGYEMLGNFLR